jgi:hypothetical protein
MPVFAKGFPPGGAAVDCACDTLTTLELGPGRSEARFGYVYLGVCAGAVRHFANKDVLTLHKRVRNEGGTPGFLTSDIFLLDVGGLRSAVEYRVDQMVPAQSLFEPSLIYDVPRDAREAALRIQPPERQPAIIPLRWKVR